MTNEEAKKMLKAKLECLKRETSGIDCNDGYNCDECELLYAQGTAGKQKEALEMAIQALEQISHLTDRPCPVCEFHTENGCSKWNCVFEQQQDKVIHNHPCEDCYYNDGDVHAECVVCNKAESEDEE